uniref:Reverse transcriptase/retrotransposon-derived protein RNase H-like domain-containing protein n=1 Tax=Acanthochromis polyacanthus TaxID=80966 RepID=A0A3Q1G665_9TELE
PSEVAFLHYLCNEKFHFHLIFLLFPKNMFFKKKKSFHLNFKLPFILFKEIGVKRLMGMANYLSKFLPHLASYTRPIKGLLCGKNEWCWEAPQKEAFRRLKSELSSTQVLAAYSPTAETCVSADTSSFGLGGVLTQRQPDGAWKPIVFISRGMSETERHYAQIEKEFWLSLIMSVTAVLYCSSHRVTTYALWPGRFCQTSVLHMEEPVKFKPQCVGC